MVSAISNPNRCSPSGVVSNTRRTAPGRSLDSVLMAPRSQIIDLLAVEMFFVRADFADLPGGLPTVSLSCGRVSHEPAQALCLQSLV